MKYLLQMSEEPRWIHPDRVDHFKDIISNFYPSNYEMQQEERDALVDMFNYQQDRYDKLLAGYEEVVEDNRMLCIRVSQLESIVYDDCK